MWTSYIPTELTCSEVVEYNNLGGPLRGVQWLPDVSEVQNVPVAQTRGHGDGQSGQLPLLSYTESEVVLFRPPQASKRLKMTESIVWAGAVCGNEMAAVRGNAAVELWQLSGTDRVAIIPPPEADGIQAPGLVTCVTAVDNEWLLLGGRLPSLVLCDVASRHSQHVPLPPGLPPHTVSLSTAPDSLRTNGKRVSA